MKSVFGQICVLFRQEVLPGDSISKYVSTVCKYFYNKLNCVYMLLHLKHNQQPLLLMIWLQAILIRKITILIKLCLGGVSEFVQFQTRMLFNIFSNIVSVSNYR